MRKRKKVMIKVCGIHTSHEARRASFLGADLVGLLVNIPGTNLSLTQQAAKQIISKNNDINFVILTIDNRPKHLLRLISKTSPWGIQLLRPTVRCVKLLVGKTKTKIIPVIHIVDSKSIKLAKEFQKADYLLLDSKTNSQLGGTGKTHDWSISSTIVKNSLKPVFLAGGLNENNVVGAIRRVKPFAIDAESSLRNKRGFRAYDKIERFIAAAKST